MENNKVATQEEKVLEDEIVDAEVVQEILIIRTYNYTLLQALFGSEPTVELLENLVSETTKLAFELYSDEEHRTYNLTVANVMEIIANLPADKDEARQSLSSEYTRLFIGPGELTAAPWESLYLSNKGLLFDENTLAVRNFYRSQGFLPAEYPRVADDHIALECGFMAELAKIARNSFNGDDPEILDTSDAVDVSVAANEQALDGELAVANEPGQTTKPEQTIANEQEVESKTEQAIVAEREPATGQEAVKNALVASLKFLDEHLLVWVPKYCDKLAGAKGAKFYPQILALALEFFKHDRDVISEIIASLEV